MLSVNQITGFAGKHQRIEKTENLILGTYNQRCLDMSKYKPLTNPSNMYLFKVSNRNTRKKCELCSKLVTKTLDEIIDTRTMPVMQK